MRVLGLVLIVACTTLTGVKLSFNLLRRVKRLEDAINLTGLFAGELRYTMAPMQGIVARAAQQVSGLSFLAVCAKLCVGGSPFPKAWQQALTEAPSGLDSEDIKTLAHLGTVLGAIDLNGALSELEYATFALKERHKEAKAKQERLGGLYRTLGTLTGIGIVIMLM